ncbi:integrase [Pelomonas aquatica]|uniref:Integrase n=1 Tax=Pelomonas aquatica TaxID=431058 RepID=A0ABU1ZCB3_9BURK|nr:site-specific integrase [Pelomonas aquatica]MDR7298264.1 integrase [Pelomonas aquatica]
MRFVLSSDRFVFAEQPRPGFPLILDARMEPAEPFHSYLIWRLLDAGAALDSKTWESYGRALWDFAKFLDANGLTWNQPFSSPGHGVVVRYRDWQISLRLDAGTINQRMRLVVGLYEWAARKKQIRSLPFHYREVTPRSTRRYASNRNAAHLAISRPNVLLAEWEKEPAFLLANQVKQARREIRSTSQRLLFDLMARVGLRSVEARTFPIKYVFDPRIKKDLNDSSMIFVNLSPNDMDIKFDKPRSVAVPFSLMEDLWAYTRFERNRLLAGRTERRELLITVNGNPFSKTSAGKVFSYLAERIGFKITPLMLRHTYAIHTLLVLRANPNLGIEPLMWLRDRLGHSHVETTMTYLRQIERLMGAEAEQLMSEFDRIYGI